MSASVVVAWDEAFTTYNFGPSHPMAPARIDLTIRLARALGVFDHPHVSVVSPPVADDELLQKVHSTNYLMAVKQAAQDPDSGAFQEFGLGTEDDPCFSDMHEASARIVGGTVEVTRAVFEGRAEHGINIAGGLHHALPGKASGFCIYNDPAIAIQWLLDHGVERVAYVDIDVHHGDGVEQVFWDDPRVLTISLHETPRTLFPGTGYPDQIGGKNAEGTAVNVALPPGTSDRGWLRAFHAVVPPLLNSFHPQYLFTQHGADTHTEDPLAHLALTVDGQRAAAGALHRLAHDICGGRWIAVGGGGYEIVDVVPRTWTHLIAEVAGRPIPPETAIPEEWLDHVFLRFSRHAPRRMTDGGSPSYVSWETGYDPGDWLDRAVLATRKAVFPVHGLDPHW